MTRRRNHSGERGGLPASDAPVRWSYDLEGKPVIVREQPLPAPASSIDDEPRACLFVNADWSRHVSGALDALSVSDAWATNHLHATQQIERLINMLYASCDMPQNFLLRQNPVNPCRLEQSPDGGATWTLAFDYSRCRPRARTTITSFIDDRDTILTELNNISNTWNNNIVSIYTILEWGDSDDLYRDTALCYLTKSLTDAVCDFVIANIRLRQNNQLGLLNVIDEVVNAFERLQKLFFMRIAKTVGLTAFALDLESRVLSAWVNTVSNAAIAPFENTSARDEVACCWYNAMNNFTPTLSIFQSALNSCSGLSPDATIIRDALQEFLVPVPAPTEPVGEHVFFVFADLYQQAIDLAKAGIITSADCPCVPALPALDTFEWVYTNNSSPLVPPPSWTFFADRPLSSVAGFIGYGQYVGGGSQNYVQTSMVFSFALGTINSVRVGGVVNGTPSVFRRINVKLRRSGVVVYDDAKTAVTNNTATVLFVPNVAADSMELQVETQQTYAGAFIRYIKVN